MTNTTLAALKDLRMAGQLPGEEEVRFLVNAYYMLQKDRKRYDAQVRALNEQGKPRAVIALLGDEARAVEQEIKKHLDGYSASHPIGRWMRQFRGVGPVISAGFLAHFDITKATYATQFWAFAGLIPGVERKKGKKCPFNIELKTLCWHLGECIVRAGLGKKPEAPEAFYVRMFKERKDLEIKRNEDGENREAALEAAKKVGKNTVAYKHYSQGKLPPAHVHARARRWVVKLFLSHLHEVWYEWHHGKKAPEPYIIKIGGHTRIIPPPIPLSQVT